MARRHHRDKRTERFYIAELQRGTYKYEDAETENCLHANIHDALEAFDELPAKV
ncbi:hypothetical protein ACFFQF_16990 [Haladaptatus pallidirubidus]|uniref:Uncharacterized protein n=1 Tax=Haladaptatus pallidirubidus TaxID=1008152 RepID=A0AAV3URP1_9EURY|nr:hypothetical protein [Haladaptatus pallidirubidus]